MSSNLPPYNPGPLRGTEQFHRDSQALQFTVNDFWQWSASDLLNNTQRGILAEFLVAKALGHVSSVRTEWAAYDLETASGTTIEVKSAAYLQSWQQEQLSKVSFGISRTRGWDPKTNITDPHPRRQADVYVFCLIRHQDKETVDPLNLAQWCFYVVPTAALEREVPTQKSLTLGRLEQLGFEPLGFEDLRSTIERFEAGERDSAGS